MLLTLLALRRAFSALPYPSCALNGLPCVVPVGWQEKASWNLTESTVINPGITEDLFRPKHYWGLIVLDWSVGYKVWDKGGNNSNCEAILIENCRLIKLTGMGRQCFIYHNIMLALQWMESERAIMYDPKYRDLFVLVKDNRTGVMMPYNEPNQFGDQFFFDYRNFNAIKWFTEHTLPTLMDPAVDGTYTDDVAGAPDEHPQFQNNTKFTDKDIEDLRFATGVAAQLLIDTLAVLGKGVYHAFGGYDDTVPGPNSQNCIDWMRTHCAPEYQGRLMMMRMNTTIKEQTVAAFLISRPPVGYLGYGWMSDDGMWDDIFLLQVGEPKELCVEQHDGVFIRAYTMGTARLNCNTWTATLPFKPL